MSNRAGMATCWPKSSVASCGSPHQSGSSSLAPPPAARQGPDSDLDLLVIKPGRYHRGRLTEEIYLSLIGVGQAVDVVVVTPEDVDRYRDALGLVIAPALREGRVVYAA